VYLQKLYINKNHNAKALTSDYISQKRNIA